jgi:hypothetical protein
MMMYLSLKVTMNDTLWLIATNEDDIVNPLEMMMDFAECE